MNSSDPWGLLDKEVASHHCPGKTAVIVMYDHTGAERARCQCGEEYWHDYGAHVAIASPERWAQIMVEMGEIQFKLLNAQEKHKEQSQGKREVE